MDTCCKSVWGQGAYHSHPCGRKAKVERNGRLYCGQHDPEAVAKRDAERKAKWDIKWEAEQMRMNRRAAGVQSLDLLESMDRSNAIPEAFQKQAAKIFKLANKKTL